MLFKLNHRQIIKSNLNYFIVMPQIITFIVPINQYSALLTILQIAN